MTTSTGTAQVTAGGVTVGGVWGDPRDEDDDTAPSGQEASA